MAQVGKDIHNNGINKTDGNIKKVYMRNFGRFKDNIVIDLVTLDTQNANLPALVGASGSGKSFILACIAVIDVFRHTFEAAPENNGGIKIRSVKQGDNLEDGDILQDYSRLFTGSAEDEWEFDKCEEGKEGLFVVETCYNGQPAYYGMYAKESEKSWVWHKKGVDDSYRFSTAFIYSEHDGKIFLMSPDYMSGERLVKAICMEPCPAGGNIVEFMGNSICAFLRQPKQCVVKHTNLPTQIEAILPSVVLTFEAVSRLGMRQSDNVAWVDKILKGAKSKGIKCLLFENPTRNITQVNAKCIIRKMMKLCKANDMQIIMSTNSSVLPFDHRVHPVIRLWKTSPDTSRAAALSSSFSNDFENMKLKKEEKREFLVASMVLLVEGMTDSDILVSIFENWIESLCEIPTEDTMHDIGAPSKVKGNDDPALECLLKGIHCLNVDGKSNFHKAIDFLLTHGCLGFPHFIVCDLDAIVGKSAEEMVDYFTFLKEKRRKKREEERKKKKVPTATLR